MTYSYDTTKKTKIDGSKQVTYSFSYARGSGATVIVLGSFATWRLSWPELSPAETEA